MKIKTIKWSNRKIKIYFDTKRVEGLKKELHLDETPYGYTINSESKIVIRTNMDKVIQRTTLWHELGHILLNSLGGLDSEATVETYARFIDEVFSRNKWLRQLYLKEEKVNERREKK